MVVVASAFPAVKGPVGCWYKLPNASVSAEQIQRLTFLLRSRLYIFAQAYDGRIILLFEMGFTHDSDTCRCRCSSLNVSPLHLQQICDGLFLFSLRKPEISVCAACINTIVHHFNSVKNRIRCTDKKNNINNCWLTLADWRID